jgi:arylsulfatase A-like enzyme
MAKEGMKLTSFYDAPECSVSRAQIMTGCYGQRVTIVGVLPPASRIGLSASEHTVAELLKDQGYATMCVGKWHLGDAPDYLPTHRGFDHYFGLPYSNDMNDRSKVTGQPVVPLMRDDQVAELITNPQQHFLTKRYTEEAVKFIQDNKDHPFFLYFAHTAVHTPISPGPDFQGKSKNGQFGDWVEEVDWSVGQVLDTLRQLKLDSNTLVMFTSDNGPWLAQGTDAGTAAPLRGGKFTTWEGGVREPTLAWWPGHVPAGVVTDTIGRNIDFLPTFVSLAGGTVPSSPKIDGQDISPLLLGKTTTLPNDVYYYYRLHELDAVREGPWKLALRAQLEGDRWEKGSHLPPDANTDAPRLYNLDTDIGERTNVAAQHPDIVAHLTDLFNAMLADLGTDGKPGPGVRPPGRIAHPVMLYPAIMKPRPGSG